MLGLLLVQGVLLPPRRYILPGHRWLPVLLWSDQRTEELFGDLNRLADPWQDRRHNQKLAGLNKKAQPERHQNWPGPRAMRWAVHQGQISLR